MPHNLSLEKMKVRELNSGFGLVELLVSISIVVLVMGIIMARHSSYEGAVLLRSQAYQIALQIREVQLMAVSATGQGGEYRNVFGVHLDSSSGSNGFYYTFKDEDSDFYYDSAEQLGKRNNLDPRFEISAIRLMPGATTESNLSVTFERPNFDAIFNNVSGTVAASTIEIDVCRKGTSCTAGMLGEVRTVEISRTGQITVQ
jgi:type II secretory pathway pseudopilin PulG